MGLANTALTQQPSLAAELKLMNFNSYLNFKLTHWHTSFLNMAHP